MTATREMANESLAHEDYRRDLDDGLLLRWSTPDDVERVAALVATVFRHAPDAPPHEHDAIWARSMFSGRHPHISPRDYAVVEDTRTGALVACTCLLSQSCAYEGIPFRLGNPELVATLPEYRRRGLVRAIFELIHARSAVRGHLAQGITGIPYFYRQFGYEYAALLDRGLTIYAPAIPALDPAATEPYTLREATVDDAPLLSRLWDQWARARSGAALWTAIEDDYWRWAIAGMHPEAKERWRVQKIVETGGNAAERLVGALIERPGERESPFAQGAVITIDGLMVDADVPLVRVVPSLLRGLCALADTVAPATEQPSPTSPPVAAITLRWGGPPLRAALGDIPFYDNMQQRAWYLRVADLPRFLRHIAPALERRLASSPHAGYTGDLTLNFYRAGLHLAFDHGTLTAVEDWRQPLWGDAAASFPPLVFLQALFGYRGLDELCDIYPDVRTTGDATPLLAALFPKRPSLLLPLD